MCKTSVEKTFTLMKARYQSKLNRLLNRKTKRAIAFNEEKNKKLIINFSNKTVTECQEDVLKLGLNFAPVPTKLPLIDTVTAVEAVTKFLNEDKANDLRGRVCGNYVAMWLLNYSGCGTFRDFESDIFMNFRLWVSLLVNLACTTEKI